MRKRLAVVLILLVLFGTGSGGGYQKRDTSGYGYQDTHIQDDIYRVDFEGGSGTEFSALKDFTLLRCAQLALEKGYTHFIILDVHSDTRVTVFSAPGRAFYDDPFYRYRDSFYYNQYRDSVTTLTEPVLSHTIQCFREMPAGAAALVYDARQTAENIRAKYKLE
jgi:hypothetical protein